MRPEQFRKKKEKEYICTYCERVHPTLEEMFMCEDSHETEEENAIHQAHQIVESQIPYSDKDIRKNYDLN
jgi:hypothetical protein